MQRIGVFVCHCGSNIAATVDVEAVARAAKHEDGVVFASDYQYMCSEAGQNLIKDTIRNEHLTGVVICSCSPRMHEATFRKACSAAGLNSYMVEIANLREQCSWIHKDKAEATEKAIILMRTAVAKVLLNAPLTAGTSPVTKRALVIGGGIAGIQTALDIAEAGYPVDIVERDATIGGKMTQIDKTFPTLDCAACILTPKMVEAAQNDKIRIYTYSEVHKVKGFVGNFNVTIKRKPRFVDETKCTGCGLCTEKCPQRAIPNEFNLGLDKRSAIYIPFAQAVPKVATIDPNSCLMLKSGKCGLCSKLCEAGAIDYKAQEQFIEEQYGAIVVATGFNPINPEKYDEFAYSQSPDVVTSLEYERLMNAAGPTGGVLLRPSDKTHPKTIVFVQCVGSRESEDSTKCGKEYCSKICCMYTAKHAMLTREKYPDTEVYVFYIDVRTPGKNFDEFYRRAVEQYGVHYIKGMVGKVVPENGKLKVQGSDLIFGKQLHIDADMVVLAVAIEPDKSARGLATMLTTQMDTNDFFTEAHPKLRPVESATAGIFLSGACQGPKDIPETVAQGSAAAAKVIGLLSKDSLICNPCVAHSDEILCSGCSQCENVCPYGAITYIDKEFRMPDRTTRVRRVASVNPAVCQGCGACTVTCPSGAMDLKGFATKQIMAEVDKAAYSEMYNVQCTMYNEGRNSTGVSKNEADDERRLEMQIDSLQFEKKPFRPSIVAFCCNWCSYAGADLAGTNRLNYPADVKIIRVPCSCRVNPLFILRAFQRGADGVIICGCHPGDCHYTSGNYFTRRRMTLLFSMLDYLGIERDRTRVEWISAAEGQKFARTMNEFTETVAALGKNKRLEDLRCKKS